MGRRDSEAQLNSSRKRMPSFFPVSSMVRWTWAMISLMVYSVMETGWPSTVPSTSRGRPMMDCRVWWVTE